MPDEPNERWLLVREARSTWGPAAAKELAEQLGMVTATDAADLLTEDF